MQTITVIYSRSRTLAAALIRLASWWGPWSHCGIVHKGYVIESLALKGGVVATPLQEVIDRSSLHEIVDVEVTDADAGLHWAWGTVGAPYDWMGVLAIPFRARRLASSRRWYCSEHVETALRIAGAHRWRDRTHRLHGISPNQSYFNR